MSRLAAALALTLALAGSALAEEAPSPLTLSDPGGQDLVLKSLDVRVAAHGPLSLTELDMVFENPADRVVEGRFQCLLPQGATVSRFAKSVHGELMEGEVVEKQRAIQIYTKILHSLRDPALLHQARGNRFLARVFPIGARDTVRLLLSFSRVTPATAAGQRVLEVPLRGLPQVERLGIQVACRGFPGEQVQLSGWLGAGRIRPGDDPLRTYQEARRDFLPKQDLQIVFRAPPQGSRPQLLRAGPFRMLAVRPDLALPDPYEEPDAWSVWVDTSASGATSAAHRTRILDAFLTALAAAARPRARLRITAFDQDQELLADTRVGVLERERVAEALAARGFFGATRLGAALATIGAEARAATGPRTFVLVTDAIPTLGPREAGPLREALGAWPPTCTLHVLVLGSAWDDQVARALAEAGGGRVLRIPIDTAFRDTSSEVVADLRRPVGRTVTVTAPGAEWVEPREFRDLRPGAEVVTFLRYAEDGPPAPPALAVDGGDASPVSAAEASEPDFAPLLSREGYRAQLARLDRRYQDAEDVEVRTAVKREMIDLSVAHRVLCRWTAMLVLESEQDYQRFGLDRTALADILRVGERGIELINRKLDAAQVAAMEAARKAAEEARKAAEEERRRQEEARKEAEDPRYPPGRDPLIRLHAPADVTRVMAVFPWGEIRRLRRHPRTGAWECRFLVPADTVHGRYQVVLVMTRGDGRKQRLVFSFHADRRRPTGMGAGAVARTDAGWRLRVEVTASADTSRAVLQLPAGKTLELNSGEAPGAFRGEALVAAPTGPTLTVPVTLFDAAHNRITLELELEVRP